jgi:hypothetical protein
LRSGWPRKADGGDHDITEVARSPKEEFEWVADPTCFVERQQIGGWRGRCAH